MKRTKKNELKLFDFPSENKMFKIVDMAAQNTIERTMEEKNNLCVVNATDSLWAV